MTNVDPREIDKFEAMAQQWWNPDGPFQPLHDLNPVRLKFLQQFASMAGAQVLDIGCGAGLLSEAMAAEGALVTGIDLAEEVLNVAERHAQSVGLDVDYQLIGAEDFAAQHPAQFDIVSCLEMLEHVPHPEAIIEAATAALKSGGKLFLSTINRTPAAFSQAILGAEYLLGLLPKGTHTYRDFIRPSELDRVCRGAGLIQRDIRGLGYQPFARRAWLHENVRVNYIACYQKP